MSALARLADHFSSTSRLQQEAVDDVVTTAVLVATAFRLRDEEALVLALRRLVEAVRRLETEDD